MKQINKILLILSLVVHAYFPFCMLFSKIFNLSIRLYFPLIPSVINLTVTFAALVFSFLYSVPSFFDKILAVILTPIAALNFSFYFIYSENTAATILGIASYILVAILTMKTLKSIASRIIIPITVIAIGAVTFVLSLIFAIVIGLGNKDPVVTAISPSGDYRAEVSERDAIISNGYIVKLYDTEKEFNPPFILLYPEGKEIWSGVWDENSSIEWKDEKTLIVNSEIILLD